VKGGGAGGGGSEWGGAGGGGSEWEVLVEVEKMNNSIRFTLCSCPSATSPC